VPVEVLGTIPFRGGEKAGFETTFTVNRKDFDITWNRPAETASGGVMLGDDVLVQINLETNKAMPAPKTN